MSGKMRISDRTRNNWLIDCGLFVSGLIAFLSGIYFLFLPVGGYQGGRNPYYGITILFDRHTWENWHAWGGLIMIAIAAIHIPVHWAWIVNMTRRMIKIVRGRCQSMNAGSKINLAINSLIGASFLLTALSGLYYFLALDTVFDSFVFTPVTWDLIHTWSGVVMIAAAVLHFAIHWRWALKVTRKMYLNLTMYAAIGSSSK